MIRAVALLLACLVSSARAGMGEDDANDIKGRGFGKPTNVVVEPVELPPLPSNGGGCVEVYSLGNCHTSWLGQYHEQAATLNDKPIWLATSSGSEIVYQAHAYGWWLKHCDSHLGSLQGGGFPCMSGDKHGAQPVTCEYFGGEHECGIRKCR